MNKNHKRILILLIKYDKESGGNVFGTWKERRKFKKCIKRGEISKEYSFSLWDLLGLYEHNLSKEDREEIDYLYAQATNEEFDETLQVH